MALEFHPQGRPDPDGLSTSWGSGLRIMVHRSPRKGLTPAEKRISEVLPTLGSIPSSSYGMGVTMIMVTRQSWVGNLNAVIIWRGDFWR